MVSVWTLTGTFRRRRRVLGVDACLMRFYDPAMQKKSICNLRHLFKNITEFGVWYKYDVFGHFAFILVVSDVNTAAGLRTRSGSETFLQPDVRRDLFYSFISQIFMFGLLVSLKSHFVKRCCDRGAEAFMSEDWNWTWATSAQTWRKNSLFELLVSSRLFLHDLVAVQNQRW